MSNDPPQNPRSRLIVPGKPDRPRTRLIAPAVDAVEETAQDLHASMEDPASAGAEQPVAVAPLAPPPPAAAAPEGEDGEPAIGEAEQGEFTVIDEDTGETHTVPVKVSSMSPPPVAVAVADPEPVEAADSGPDARALADAEAAEAARQQAEYEAELAVYEQQKAEYEAAQQQAAYEAAQQQAYHAAQPPTQYAAQAYAPHAQPVQPRTPQTGGYAPRPMAGYGAMPVVMSGGVPSWALVMIGLLIGFVMSVLAYKFTDFGKMIRPDSKRAVEQTSVPVPFESTDRRG